MTIAKNKDDQWKTKMDGEICEFLGQRDHCSQTYLYYYFLCFTLNIARKTYVGNLAVA